LRRSETTKFEIIIASKTIDIISMHIPTSGACQSSHLPIFCLPCTWTLKALPSNSYGASLTRVRFSSGRP
jgi:hypothetical protein